MKTSHPTSGFTLLELLLVMGIIGMMLAALSGPISTHVAKTRVKEAAEQFARDVQSQHFEAKRRNITRSVTVTPSGATYRINNTSTFTLPQGVKFSSASSGSITFYGPYGTTIATNGVEGPNLQTFTLVSGQNSTITRTVTVVGLIGKVIVK